MPPTRARATPIPCRLRCATGSGHELRLGGQRAGHGRWIARSDPRAASLLAAPIARMQRLEPLLSPHQLVSEVARLAGAEPIAPGARTRGGPCALRGGSRAFRWASTHGRCRTGLTPRASHGALDSQAGACRLPRRGVRRGCGRGGGDVAVAMPTLEIIDVRHLEEPAALAVVVEVASAAATFECYERRAHLVYPRGGLRARPRRPSSAAPCGSPMPTTTEASLGGAEVLASICLRNGLTGFVASPTSGSSRHWTHRSSLAARP